MITMMKIMRKIKIIIIKALKENQTNKQTNTITTNKTCITDKVLSGEEREKKKITYLLHPNYKKTTLSDMQRKHHVH